MVLILFGYRNDEAQVGAYELVKCYLVTLADALCQLDLFVDGNQLFAANLLEVLVQRCALAIGDRFCNLELSHFAYAEFKHAKLVHLFDSTKSKLQKGVDFTKISKKTPCSITMKQGVVNLGHELCIEH